jgi:hypothetical protein
VGGAGVRGRGERLRHDEEGVGVPWWLWAVAGAVALVVVGVLGVLGVMAWLEVRAASGEDSDGTS